MKKSELRSLIKEVIQEVLCAETAASKTLSWKDGVRVDIDITGKPIGYKFLGYANSGITIPKADDWRRFYVSSDGNTERLLSPKLKVWYEIDSSG
jgi:hypothetical protein